MLSNVEKKWVLIAKLSVKTMAVSIFIFSFINVWSEDNCSQLLFLLKFGLFVWYFLSLDLFKFFFLHCNLHKYIFQIPSCILMLSHVSNQPTWTKNYLVFSARVSKQDNAALIDPSFMQRTLACIWSACDVSWAESRLQSSSMRGFYAFMQQNNKL